MITPLGLVTSLFFRIKNMANCGCYIENKSLLLGSYADFASSDVEMPEDDGPGG